MALISAHAPISVHNRRTMLFVFGGLCAVLTGIGGLMSITHTPLPFTQQMAAVVIPFGGNITATTTSLATPLLEYLEVMDSCGPYYQGTCVNMRSGPGEQYPLVAQLRTGVVLRVSHEVTVDGQTWAKIQFDGVVNYPDRLPADLYVSTAFVRTFYNDGNHDLGKNIATTSKRILVDISSETLYAYDGDELFMQEPISTGLELTPTARGTFTIYKMTPARYMQGPLLGSPSDQIYDLPGVPWNMYFTTDGAVIHGAYWHDHFGQPWSHGCVNLAPQNAKKLYDWAVVGTKVTVQN